MLKLFLFNCLLISIIVIILIVIKSNVKEGKTQNLILLISSIITILFHYSSFIFKLIFKVDSITYLNNNPNLILPIYPCNVVMWCCLIFGLLKNKSTKFSKFLIDYIFWFGIFSTLVGMFANVDFINNPTLLDYEITKSIAAHATLLLNVLLLPLFGYIKIDFKRNMLNMILAVIVMYAIGVYCNLIFEVLVSYEKAFDVNSMFIIHSPFDGLNFLKYPFIASIALILYFVVFTICEIITKEKEEVWFNKLFIKK
jgi:hypothetical protein